MPFSDAMHYLSGVCNTTQVAGEARVKPHILSRYCFLDPQHPLWSASSLGRLMMWVPNMRVEPGLSRGFNIAAPEGSSTTPLATQYILPTINLHSEFDLIRPYGQFLDSCAPSKIVRFVEMMVESNLGDLLLLCTYRTCPAFGW